MEDNIFYGKLIDIYGEFLTEKQRNIIESYYDCDLSLGEIGDNLGISKQAVSDAKRKAEKILKNFESKLGLLNLKSQLNDLSKEKDIGSEVSERLSLLADSIGG